MSSRRIAKVAEALRECVSTTVLFELKDPRAKNVTVLHTEVSPDLRSARVFVSVMGDEKAQLLAMHGLRSARGFIQSRIADKLELRYTPILKFVLDPGVKMSVQASSIIREALASQAMANQEAGFESDESDESDGGRDGEELDEVEEDEGNGAEADLSEDLLPEGALPEDARASDARASDARASDARASDARASDARAEHNRAEGRTQTAAQDDAAGG